MTAIERRLNALEKAVGLGRVPKAERCQFYLNTMDNKPFPQWVEEKEAELLAKYGTTDGVEFIECTITFESPDKPQQSEGLTLETEE